MTNISNQGRQALSSKANAQKSTGDGGKFGHLQHAESASLQPLKIPADWNDPSDIAQHLNAAGLNGAVRATGPGQRHFDDNINESGHLLYENEQGEVIAMGRNAVGTLVASAVQEVDTEGYFITEFDEGTTPDEIVQSVFADREDDELFDVHIDYSDTESIEEGLIIAGFQGTAETIDSGHRDHDMEISSEDQTLYTSPGGHRITIGVNEMQDISVTLPDTLDTDGYTHLTFAEDTKFADVINESIAASVSRTHLNGAFGYMEEPYERHDIEVASNNGVISGNILVKDEMEDDGFYRAKFDGATGESTVVHEYTGHRIDQEKETEILEQLRPTHVRDGASYKPTLGELFTSAVKNIEADTDYTDEVARIIDL